MLFGGQRCKGMGTTIGIILLIFLFLSFIGAGIFTYFTIKNSENKVFDEENII